MVNKHFWYMFMVQIGIVNDPPFMKICYILEKGFHTIALFTVPGAILE